MCPSALLCRLKYPSDYTEDAMIERHAIPAGQRLHPLRPHYLNASEVGAAAGVDPHKSRLQLYCEKTGELPAQEDNAAMQRGRWLESGVVAALIDHHPDWDIRYPLDLYFCDPETRQGCTPDAAAGIDGAAGQHPDQGGQHGRRSNAISPTACLTPTSTRRCRRAR